MRLLVLDAALGDAVAAVLEDVSVLADAGPGDQRSLAERVARLPLDGIAAVCVTVGPGSFTGLRAALALAHGLALARGVTLVPVTVAEALGEALPHRGGRVLWVAIDSRRERVFLDRGEGMQALMLAEVPRPDRRVAVAGDAAVPVAARIAAAGGDVMLTDARRPRPRDVASAALRRLSGEWAPLAAVPLYVDPPAVTLPATAPFRAAR